MAWGPAEYIAAASGVVSLFSFVWAVKSANAAKRSAEESRRANLIAIHDYKLKVYDSFYRLYQHVDKCDFGFGTVSNELNIQRERVADFSSYARLAEMYFPPKVASLVVEYYEASRSLALGEFTIKENMHTLHLLQIGGGGSDGHATKERVDSLSSTVGLYQHERLPLLKRVKQLGPEIDMQLKKDLALV